MGGEEICHSPQGAGDSGIPPGASRGDNPNGQDPLQKWPQGLLFQVTKVRKSQSLPPPLLSQYSATHLGSMITESVQNRSERLTQRKFSRIF